VDTDAPPSTRVRAAEIVLDKAAKAIELEDIEARVAELERRKPQSRRAKAVRTLTKRNACFRR
jgi:hypothetical protein